MKNNYLPTPISLSSAAQENHRTVALYVQTHKATCSPPSSAVTILERAPSESVIQGLAEVIIAPGYPSDGLWYVHFSLIVMFSFSVTINALYYF